MMSKNDVIMRYCCTCNINSLTTDDEGTRHATLAACYQLVQSILKIGFALAKKGEMGEVGGHSHDMPYTWWLSWLAVEKPWSALAGPFYTNGHRKGSSAFVGAPFLAL